MTNSQIADIFEEMADLLELSGENAFRVRAYRTGARAIRDLPEDVASILQSAEKKLTDYDGIGDTLAEKSKTLIETGQLPALDKLRAQVPNTLRLVMQVPGVGAKKAAALWKELGVVDLTTLRQACEAKKVEELKGFGKKTQQSILDSMAIVEQASHRLMIHQADELVHRIQQHMQSESAIERMAFAGSYRRGRETVGDLDLLVISDHVSAVMDRFESFPERTETIQRGDTKMSIRVSDAFQVDLRVVPKESWGAALQYFTGSKDHNVRVRSIAKHKGLRVNEYGVFDTNDSDRCVAGATEEEVYAAIGLPWVPPELREARIEFEGDQPKELPKLIELSDLRGDLHMHTHATDGANSLEEMVQSAISRGLEYIAITDHSKRVSMARGLDSDRLLAQWAEIDQLNKKLDQPFTILKGIECDILESGEMDLSDEVLKQSDWVMASIHYGQKQSKQQITERILNAIRNPYVSAISHPTGRLIGRREAYEVDLTAVIQASAEFGKFLELNANPYRLDLNDIHCMMAKTAGVKIVISTDAHDATTIGQAQYGVLQARRAGLTAADVVNTLDRSSFLKLIARSPSPWPRLPAWEKCCRS